MVNRFLNGDARRRSQAMLLEAMAAAGYVILFALGDPAIF